MIEDLCRPSPSSCFAEDIIKVQSEGPYLLGGHSYGGAVAVEIALVLESWGRHVALLLVRLLRLLVS